jgi:hypothetical protein
LMFMEFWRIQSKGFIPKNGLSSHLDKTFRAVPIVVD